MLLSRKMLKNSIIVFMGNVISQTFAFLFMIIAARLLTKSDYGYISFILSVGAFFATIVSGGFPIAITRYIARDLSHRELYIANGLLANLILFLAISSFILFFFWPHIEIVAIIFAMMIMMLYLGILRGEKEFNLYALVNAGRNAIKLIILIILFFFSLVSRESVIWTYAIAGLIVILIIEIVYRKNSFTLPRYNSLIFKTLLKFSLPLLITTVFYSLTSNAGIIMLEGFLGNRAVATYKNALLFLLVYSFVPGAIGVILLPKISSTKSPRVIIKNLRDSMLFSLSIELIIFISALFVGKPLIIILLGNKYADVFPIFIIMSFGAFAASIRNIFSTLWEGTGRPWISMVDMIVAGSIIPLLTYILVPVYGIYGASYAYSAGFSAAATIDFAFFLHYKYVKKIFTPEKIHV